MSRLAVAAAAADEIDAASQLPRFIGDLLSRRPWNRCINKSAMRSSYPRTKFDSVNVLVSIAVLLPQEIYIYIASCISSTLKKVGRKSYDEGSSVGLQPWFALDPATQFTLDRVDARGLILFSQTRVTLIADELDLVLQMSRFIGDFRLDGRVAAASTSRPCDPALRELDSIV